MPAFVVALLVIVSIAICCSAAMALPISTPPNTIAHGSARLGSRDSLVPGLIAGGDILNRTRQKCTRIASQPVMPS
jgi:di/tricarboxylate transporter